MKTIRPYGFLLGLLLLNCAGTPEGSDVGSTVIPADSKEVEQQHSWLKPEQERWVEEPVFQGSLHLVEGGRENLQTIVLIHGLGSRVCWIGSEYFPNS